MGGGVGWEGAKLGEGMAVRDAGVAEDEGEETWWGKIFVRGSKLKAEDKHSKVRRAQNRR